MRQFIAFVISLFLSLSPVVAAEYELASEQTPAAPAVYSEEAEDPDADLAETEDQEEAEEAEEEAEEKEEIMEVFVPKPKRYVWKDEQASGGSENSSTGSSSSGSSISEKLNKISGAGASQ